MITVVFLFPTIRPLRLSDVLPGVLLCTAGLLLLQSVGAFYVELTIERASITYGLFAVVIGLLSWFWLTAQLLLIGAEVNAVRADHLWPRSLRGTLTEPITGYSSATPRSREAMVASTSP